MPISMVSSLQSSLILAPVRRTIRRLMLMLSAHVLSRKSSQSYFQLLKRTVRRATARTRVRLNAIWHYHHPYASTSTIEVEGSTVTRKKAEFKTQVKGLSGTGKEQPKRSSLSSLSSETESERKYFVPALEPYRLFKGGEDAWQLFWS